MLSQIYVGLIIVSPIFIVGGLLHLHRKYWPKKTRSPLTQDLLRSPGESVRKEWMNAYDEFANSLLMISFFPSMMLAAHVVNVHYLGAADSFISRLSIGIIVLSVVVFFAIRVIKIKRLADNYRLGYEAEVAVGQELNQLYKSGFEVFHDFPANNFNIDHIVVGPTGVFSIETKGRSKPIRGKGSQDARVVFEGGRLNFPTWTETDPIDQAKRQSQWLSQWLNKAIGEQVLVTPVLVLPGWFVEQKSKADFVLYNGKNPQKIFPKLYKEKLDGKKIAQISHQLESRCRDVKPRNAKVKSSI